MYPVCAAVQLSTLPCLLEQLYQSQQQHKQHDHNKMEYWKVKVRGLNVNGRADSRLPPLEQQRESMLNEIQIVPIRYCIA